MRTDELHIRDPFVLVHDNRYHLYGTRAQSAWGPMDGFDCHVGDDLTNWGEAIEVFRNDGGFWADRCYWAPECVQHEGAFYLIATFKSATRHMGVQILKSHSPTGPFLPHSDGPVTPPDMECLDGTLHVAPDGTPHLVFSHSFTQNPDSPMCAIPLKRDLSAADGEVRILFRSGDAPWTRPFPYAKAEFGIDGDCYLSDGPFLHRLSTGRLILLWSSFVDTGYSVGMAVSDGEIDGTWTHMETPFIEMNGGHGMLFHALDGRLIFCMHHPNDKGHERPLFLVCSERNGELVADQEHAANPARVVDQIPR